MKLLFCARCADIIAPLPTPNTTRYCRCEEHAVWWVDPITGILRVWSRSGARDAAWVLGLHNEFLTMPLANPTIAIAAMLEHTPPNYLFKRWNSPIVRIRPGGSSDTAYAEALPQPLATSERIPGPPAPPVPPFHEVA